jgi:hypothetical protein
MVTTGGPLSSSGHVTLPGLGEVLVKDRESDVGQQWREDSSNAIANFEFDVALSYVKGEKRGRKVHHYE